MSRVPLSPTVPTTTTSTSSNAGGLFPFHPAAAAGGSPTPSSQTSGNRAQRTAEARAAFTASLRSAGAHLDQELQARAKDLHDNAVALKKQEEDLQQQTEALRKENEKLAAFVREQKEELLNLGVQARQEVRELGGEIGPEGRSETLISSTFGVHGGGGDDATTVEGWDDALGVLSPENLGDLDGFLQGVENDLLILEETCRIVEDGEALDDHHPQDGTEEIPTSQQAETLAEDDHRRLANPEVHGQEHHGHTPETLLVRREEALDSTAWEDPAAAHSSTISVLPPSNAR